MINIDGLMISQMYALHDRFAISCLLILKSLNDVEPNIAKRNFSVESNKA